MAKAYTQVKPELADSAAIDAFVQANPTQFTLGTIIVAANGDTRIVTVAATGASIQLVPLVTP